MENDLPALSSFWDHQAVDAQGLAECVFDSFVILEPWYLMERSYVSCLFVSERGTFLLRFFEAPSKVLSPGLGMKLLYAQTCIL